LTASLSLYDDALDDRCYVVRLFLSVLRLDAQIIAVDVFPGSEHIAPPVSDIDPDHGLPVLRDGERVLSGTGPIVAHLAQTYDPELGWLPPAPELAGQVRRWLEFAATDLLAAHRARRASLFGPAEAVAPDRAAARAALQVADDAIVRRQLGGSEWFVGDRATLADLVLFPAFALSHDYGLEHWEFDGLRRWSRRVRALTGFTTMPGIPSYR
jgi:glutathione S-transferase